MTTIIRLIVLAVALIVIADHAPALMRYAATLASAPASVDKAVAALGNRQAQLDAAMRCAETGQGCK